MTAVWRCRNGPLVLAVASSLDQRSGADLLLRPGGALELGTVPGCQLFELAALVLLAGVPVDDPRLHHFHGKDDCPLEVSHGPKSGADLLDADVGLFGREPRDVLDRRRLVLHEDVLAAGGLVGLLGDSLDLLSLFEVDVAVELRLVDPTLRLDVGVQSLLNRFQIVFLSHEVDESEGGRVGPVGGDHPKPSQVDRVDLGRLEHGVGRDHAGFLEDVEVDLGEAGFEIRHVEVAILDDDVVPPDLGIDRLCRVDDLSGFVDRLDLDVLQRLQGEVEPLLMALNIQHLEGPAHRGVDDTRIRGQLAGALVGALAEVDHVGRILDEDSENVQNAVAGTRRLQAGADELPVHEHATESVTRLALFANGVVRGGPVDEDFLACQGQKLDGLRAVAGERSVCTEGENEVARVLVGELPGAYELVQERTIDGARDGDRRTCLVTLDEERELSVECAAAECFAGFPDGKQLRRGAEHPSGRALVGNDRKVEVDRNRAHEAVTDLFDDRLELLDLRDVPELTGIAGGPHQLADEGVVVVGAVADAGNDGAGFVELARHVDRLVFLGIDRPARGNGATVGEKDGVVSHLDTGELLDRRESLLQRFAEDGDAHDSDVGLDGGDDDGLAHLVRLRGTGDELALAVPGEDDDGDVIRVGKRLHVVDAVVADFPDERGHGARAVEE